MSDAFSNLCRPKEEERLVRSTIDGLLIGRASAHQALLGVPTEAFTHHPARTIWESIQRLYRSGQAPDFPNIERDLLDNRKILGEDGWRNHLCWLEAENAGDNEESLASSVVDLYQRRELYTLYRRNLESILNPIEDHIDVAQSVATQSLRIVAGGSDSPIASGDAILAMADHRDKFRENQEETGGKLAWFGIPILDGPPDEGGIPAAPGHVVIVAARPGIGKTGFAVQIALTSANHDQEVLVASLELNRFEFWCRLAGLATETKRGYYWYGSYTDYHIGRLRSQMPTLNRIKVWDPARPTWSRLEAKIRGAALRGVRVVIIDHFSEIGISGLVKGGKKYENACECAQRIKALAKELSICIVLLAQFNREIPRGEYPTLENLRETGELEQIAYTVIAMHMDAPSGKTPSIRAASGPDAHPPLQPQLWLLNLKNRDGKTNYRRKIHFDGATGLIRDMETAA